MTQDTKNTEDTKDSRDEIAKFMDENYEGILAELQAMREERRKGRTETRDVAGTRINWR